jgi:hypothetical protein
MSATHGRTQLGIGYINVATNSTVIAITTSEAVIDLSTSGVTETAVIAPSGGGLTTSVANADGGNRFTANEPGLYSFRASGHVSLLSGSQTYRWRVLKNGAAISPDVTRLIPAGTAPGEMFIECLVRLEKNDYLQLAHTGGGSVNATIQDLSIVCEQVG